MLGWTTSDHVVGLVLRLDGIRLEDAVIFLDYASYLVSQSAYALFVGVFGEVDEYLGAENDPKPTVRRVVCLHLDEKE